jgi:ubiquinone/menaquinone biosynthesis C-methylase UbiE
VDNKYVLGNKGESERLNFQSQQRNYDSFSEVSDSDIVLNDGEVALDAGCGTGVLARRIAETNSNANVEIIGVDSSVQRIKEAQKFSTKNIHKEIKYRVEDIRDIGLPNNSVNLIVCRFVYEHLKGHCQEISNEFFRILKNNGKLIIIDTDGVLFNLDSENEELNNSIKAIKESNVNFEGYVCKKIPRYLQRSGFLTKNINVKPLPMLFFENEDREYEKELWEMRFKQIEPIFAPVLGNSCYQKFSTQYIAELMNPENFLYYSKFVFKTVKRKHHL